MSIFDNGLEGEYYVHNWGWMVQALKDNIANANSIKEALDNFIKQYETDLPERVKTEIQRAIENGTFASEIQRWIDNIPSGFLNIKDFGAKGDGVTNDTESFNNAMQAAKNGVKRVYIPSGVYVVNLVRIPSNVEVYGVRGNTILTLPDDVDQSSTFINDSNGKIGGYTANENITVHDLVFDLKFKTAGGLAFGHCSNITIYNCIFRNLLAWHFIELNACQNTKIYSCDFLNYGMSSGGVPQTLGSEMIQFDAMTDTSVFPYFGPYDSTHCENCTITNCNFENHIATDFDSVMTGHCAGIGNHTFTRGHEPHNITISSCSFKNLNCGIKFGNVVGLIVTGCKFIYCPNGISQYENGRYSIINISDCNFYGYPKQAVPNNFYGFLSAIEFGKHDRTNADSVVIENCLIDAYCTAGISISATNVIISNCNIKGVYQPGAGKGIIIGNTNYAILVTGCFLHENAFADLWITKNERDGLFNILSNNIHKVVLDNTVKDMSSLYMNGNNFTTSVEVNGATNISANNNYVQGVYKANGLT